MENPGAKQSILRSGRPPNLFPRSVSVARPGCKLYGTSTAVSSVHNTVLWAPNVCFPKGPCGSSRPKLCGFQTDWGGVLGDMWGQTRPRNAMCSITNLIMTNYVLLRQQSQHGSPIRFLFGSLSKPGRIYSYIYCVYFVLHLRGLCNRELMLTERIKTEVKRPTSILKVSQSAPWVGLEMKNSGFDRR